MNAPILLAQLQGTTTQPNSPRHIKLEKPQSGATVTVNLQGLNQLDFSDIASEKLTFVRIGDKLIVLFDNQSTITIDPVFGSDGHPLHDVSFEMAPDHLLTGEQFASDFPISTDQSILPAAGAGGGPTAGAHFSDPSVDPLSIGNPLALLGPENNGTSFNAFIETAANTTPTSTPIAAVILNEDGLPGGNPGGPGDVGGLATTFTGSLGINFGTALTGRSLAFAADQSSLNGLTSGGEAVHFTVTTVGGEPTLIAYVGSDPTIVANEVLTISLDANSTLNGLFTVTLLRPLDEPIKGIEDTLDLSINVIATNGVGQTTTQVIAVDINDDSPIVNVANETHATITDPALFFLHSTAAGSLGISWGADNFNTKVDGGDTNQNGDRGVGFTNAIVTTTGDSHGVVTSFSGLTSDGQTVHYALFANSTVLVAYTGDTPPSSPPIVGGEGESEVAPNIVFMVTLSDFSNTGSYTITQYQPLDHISGETKFDSIDLTFNFTATDSDGDPVSGAMTVTVDDTTPSLTGATTAQTVGEDGLPDGNHIVGEVQTLSVTTSLDINWGADNEIVTPANSFGRTLSFLAGDDTTAIAGGTNEVSSLAMTIFGEQGTSLTSQGVALVYVVSSDGNGGETLTATQGAGGPTVFTLSLDPTAANGAYTFTLDGPLDHAVGSDNITLGFTVQATDADGDSINQTFSVNVQDDIPVLTGFVADTTVGEEGLASGNKNLPGEVQVATTGVVSLDIGWGADDNNSGATNNRSLVFAANTISTLDAMHLTSDGHALSYAITTDPVTGQQLLTASADGHSIFTVQLSDSANGSYDFTLLGNLDHPAVQGGNEITLNFGVVAIDDDGDTVNQAFNVNIQDDVPVAGTGTGDTVKEANLFDGSSPNIHALQVTDSLNVSWGADNNDSGNSHDRSVSFQHASASADVQVTDSNGNAITGLTSNGAAVQYLIFNGELIGYTNNDPVFHQVFTVTLNDDGSGSYTFTLLNNLDHPAGNGNNTLNLTFDYTATDSDGDTSSNTFTVTVQDDVPTAHTGDTRTIDEANLPDGNFPIFFGFVNPQVSGDLNITWGADNNLNIFDPNHSRSVSFTNANAGLDVTATSTDPVTHQTTTIAGLTSDGHTINYAFLNGDLVGYTGGNPHANQVFTVSLSPLGGGSYTFTLLGTLDDPAGQGTNPVNLTFNYTATDSDGDTSNNVFTVSVKDSVPLAFGAENAHVDEDDLPNGTSPHASALSDTSDLHIGWGSDDSTRSAGDSFGRTLSFLAGDHTTVIAGGASPVTDIAMSITGEQGNNVLTSGGVALVYTVTANVNGGETLTAFKGAGGPEIFTLTLDPTSSNGSYTFTLKGPLDDAAHSDSIGLTFTVQAADADGDPVNTSFNVSIADDQPTDSHISTTTVGEEGLSFANHNVNGEAQNASTGAVSLNINWGADNSNPTPGSGLDDRSVAFAATQNALNNLHLTSNGQSLSYAVSTDPVTGGQLLTATAGSDHHTVFTVLLSDANNGSYTFTLTDNLDHSSSNTPANTQALTFSVVATDSDGDSVSQFFTVNVQDDIPVVTGSVNPQTVGEEGLSFGNHLQPNEAQNASTGDISLNISWGADQNNPTSGSGTHDRSVAFASNTISGLNNLHLTSNGQSLSYAISQDATGTLLTATAGSDNHTVFTVQLSDTANGTYNFTLVDNLDHPVVQGGNLDSFTFNVMATDSDGDTATQSFVVKVQDDIPVATAVAATTVGEGGLSFGNHLVNGEAQNASTGDVSLNISWGADANNPTSGSGAHDRSVAFAFGTVTAFNALNLTSNGQALSYTVSPDGMLLTATAGSDNHTVFTVQLSDANNGTYNFTLVDNLDHPSVQGGNLDTFTFNVVATDSDGDTVNQSFAVNVQDDIPVATAVTAQTVGEEGLSFGNHNLPGEAQNASITSSLNISWGADSNNNVASAHDRSVAFASGTVTTFNNLGLMSHGQPVTFAIATDANGEQTLTGTANGHAVFTVALSDLNNGSYTFTLMQQLDHPAGQGENFDNFTFNVVATDSDGDTVNQSFVVNVQDDVPVDVTPATQTVLEHTLIAQPNVADSVSGSLGIHFGADGPAPAGTPAITGTSTHTYTFNELSATHTGSVPEDTFTFQTDSGGVAKTGGNGELYGNQITITNGGAPFTMSSIDLGLFIGDGSQSGNIKLEGTDTNGHKITDTVQIHTSISVGDTLTFTYDTTGTKFDGVQLTSLQIASPSNNFQGDVIIDNFVVDTGTTATPGTPGPVAFTDLTTAINNIAIVDQNGNPVSAATLTSHGQQVHYELLDSMTLVAYTGTAPTSTTASNVVFSVVLSQDPTNNPNGGYTFTLDHPLDDLPASVTDLKFTFGFTATDFDGDTVPGHFSVDVHDDTPSDATTATQTVLEDTLVSQPTASVSGSLAVSFGADGPAAAGTPANPGTSHFFNFNELTNGSHTSITEGTFTITTNQGVANTTGLHGEIYGTNIGITNGGAPFVLSSIDLGLYGADIGTGDKVVLTGTDIHGNSITDIVTIGSTVNLGDPLTYHLTVGTSPFAGVELTSLHVAPASGFPGSVVIDNLGVTSGMAPAVPGPVAFTDLATAINNIAIVDQNGNSVSAATLTSHGQTVHYELLDSATLVAYTGTAPTSTTASNVVFSVVLSQDAGHPNGNYTFTLDHPLDDLPASVTDLKFTFGFTATDFDGDTAPGNFSVDVHDDVPTLVAQTPVSIVDGNFVGGPGDFPTSESYGAVDTKGSIEGWTYSASPVGGATQVELERVNSGYAGAISTDGSPMVDLEATPGNIQVSQAITGLTAGEQLAISFEIGEANFGNAKLDVLWDGNVVGTYNPQNGLMQVETIAVIGNGTGNDVLTFQEVGTPGDNTGTFLTDVSAQVVAGTVFEGGLNDTVNITVPVPNTPFTNTLPNHIIGNDPGAATTASGTLAGLVHFGADGPAMNGAAANGFQLVAQNSSDVTTFLQGLHLSSLGSAVDHGTLVGDTLTAFAADGHSVFAMTVNGDGTWTFNLTAPLDDSHQGADSVTIDFSSLVKAVDFDGDSVNLAANTFNVAVVDDLPVDTKAADTVNLSEQGLGGANPQTQVAVGFLNIAFGADDGSAEHLAFAPGSNGQLGPTLTSGGVALDYLVTTDGQGNPELIAYKDGDATHNPVFAVTLTAPGGEGAPYYSFALFQPLDEHGAGADTVALNFNINATDSDGDTVQQSFTVNVTDDVPHPTIALSGTTLTIDETAGIDPGTDDKGTSNVPAIFSALGTPIETAQSAAAVVSAGGNFGADGEAQGATPVFSLSISGTGVASGLTATDGHEIFLYQQGALVVGLEGSGAGGTTADPSGAIAFAISLDSTTGVASIAEYTAIHQPDTTNPNDAVSMADGVLFASVTYTDGDGDVVTSAPVSIGTQIHFLDDGPTIGSAGNLIVNGGFENDIGNLTSGEWSIFHSVEGWTAVTGANGNVPFELQDGNISGVPQAPDGGNIIVELDSDQTSGNMPNPDPINNTNSTHHTNSEIQQTVAGTEAGQTYELSFFYSPRPQVAGSDSSSMNVLWNGEVVKTIDSTGLQAGWQQIEVFVQGTGPNNTVAFQATGAEDSWGALIDNVSLVPVTAVSESALATAHGDAVNGNEAIIPGYVALANADGDNNDATATGTLNVNWGADNFDAPDAYSNATGFTQDGAGRSLTFTNANVGLVGEAGTTLTSHGDAVTFALANNGTELIGSATDSHGTTREVIDITLSDDGTGAYHVILKDALDDASGNGTTPIGLTFNYTATDSDGDHVGGTFTVAVNDDVPVAGHVADGTVSENGLPNVSFAVQSLNIHFGADGQGHGDLTFAMDGQGNPVLPAALTGLTSNGVALAYEVETLVGGEQQLVAYRPDLGDTHPVFEVTLNSPLNPVSIFTLYQPIDHDGTLPLTFTVNATDGDGDVVQQNFTVDITDSVPTVGTSVVGDVSEDGPKTLTDAPLVINYGTDNGTFTGSHLGLAFTDGNVTATDPNGNAMALTSYGHAISVAFIGGELVGYTGATAPATAGDSNVVFTATLNAATSTYDFTLNQPLDHPAPVGTNDSMNLTFDITATDADGSTATGHFTVNVDAAGTIGSIDYNHETTGVFVNLGDTTATDPSTGQTVDGHTATDLASGTGHVIGIDQLGTIVDATGSSANDILVGGDTENHISGGAGNDVIIGGGGGDVLDGGDGNDRIDGGHNLILNGDFQAAELIVSSATQPVTSAELGGGWTVTGGNVDIVAGGGSLHAEFPAGINMIDTKGMSDGTVQQTFATVVGDTYTVTFLQGTNPDLLTHSTDTTSSITVSAINATNTSDATETFTHSLAAGTTWTDIEQTLADQTFTFTATSTSTTLSFASNAASNGPEDYGSLFGQVYVEDASAANPDATDAITGDAGNDVIQGGAGNDAIDGGADNDLLFGGSGNDTIHGGTGDDFIVGGAGNDNLFGDQGNDTFVYTVGDGVDTVDGGDGIDTQVVTGIATSETFVIGAIDATHLGVSIGADAASAQLAISDTNVEELVINLGTAGDTVVVNGSLDGTGLATNTITINGSTGNDTVDLRNFASGEDVVYNGGSNGPAGDTVIYGFAFQAAGTSYTPVFDSNGHLIGAEITYQSADGPVTDTITNVENFQFADGTITLQQLLGPSIASSETATVTEAGGLFGIDQASLGGAFHLVPFAVQQVTFNHAIASALSDLATNPSDVHNTLGIIEFQLHSSAEAPAIAVVWDYLNNAYVNAGANQPNINEAFVYLGIEYATYLKNGGTPLVDVAAKFTADMNNDGIADRDQSLHDNLLGNITTYSLNQHFSSDPALIQTLSNAISAVDADLLNRPYASGNEGDTGNAEAHAFDVADGFANQVHGTLTATDPMPNTTLTWSISGPQTYGTMAIDATGHWTYTLDDSLQATQALAQGDTATQTFTATVTDNLGQTDTTTVTITIDGSNDAPVISATSVTSEVVAESSQLPGFDQAGPNGAFHVAPGLAAEMAQHPQVAVDLAALPGNPSGVANSVSAIEAHLNVNEATAIAIVWDSLNTAYVAQGANQAGINQAFVYLGVEYAAYLKNGGTPLLDVTAKFTADSNNDGIADRDQSLHDNLLGNITEAALQQHFAGDTATLATLTAAIDNVDANLLNRPYASGNEGDAGNAAAHTYDANVLHYGAGPASNSLIATGQLVATDPDHGATQTWSIVNDSATSYGTMTIDTHTGAWTYTLDPTLASTQALAQGETATQTFTATVTDDHGLTDTINVTVTIDGTNDAPVINVASSFLSGNVFEAGAVSGLDQASLDNAFHIDPALAAQAAGNSTVASELAALPGNPSDVQHLIGTIEDQLHVNTMTAIGIVWDNLNTAYVAQGANQAGINEAFVYLGIQYAFGVEHNGALLVDVTAKFTPDMNNDGVADRDQSLHDNLLGNITSAALLQHFASDPSLIATLTSAISAINPAFLDRPYASGNEGDPGNDAAHAFDVAHGFVNTAVGEVVATDPDHGATQTWSIVNDSSTVYGTMSIDAHTGVWTYQLDNSLAATQALADGQIATQTFTATVTDDHGATASTTVTVNVLGTNDAATFAGVDLGSVTAAGATSAGSPTAGGTLTVSDVDSSHLVTPENNIATAYGHFSIDANGVWSYALDNSNTSVEALTPTSTPLVDAITVTTADGTTHDIDVSIHGGVHAPVVSAQDLGTIADTAGIDANVVKATGNLLVGASDADSGATLTVTQIGGVTVDPVSGGNLVITDNKLHVDVGTLHVDANGDYSFTASPGLDAETAAGGFSEFVTFAVTSSEGATVTSFLTFNVTGTADTPAITSGTTATEAEHTAINNVVYQATATDRDSPSNLVYSLGTGGDNADFNISSTGAVTFVNPPDYLTQHAFSITVNVSENGVTASENVTINVTPMNSGPATLTITDASHSVFAPVVGDVLTANLGTDPDGGQSNVHYQWFDNGLAISNNANDSTYTVAPTDIGHSITVQATYIDGKSFGESVTTLIGTGKVIAPPVAGNDIYSVNENGVLNVSIPGVQGNDTDPNGVTPTSHLVSGPAHGALTLNADGSLIYTPTAGFHGTDSFTYNDTDSTGLTSNTATATITVNAVNTGAASLSITDTTGGHLVTAPVVGDVLHANLGVDPDGGTNIGSAQYIWFDNGVQINGAFGSSYALVSTDVGHTITVQATYLDNEGFNNFSNSAATGNVIAPPVAGNDIYSVNENGVLNVSIPGVQGNDTDPNGLTPTSHVVSGPAHGALTLNADGSLIYTPTAGFHGTDSFTYNDTDSTGLTSNTATATITVNPVNTGAATLTIQDNSGHSTTAPHVGDVLQANLGADPDGGTNAPTALYQWFDNGTLVSSAGSTYTVKSTDVGHTITVEAVYSDNNGFSNDVTSGATGTVVSNNNPPVFGIGALTGEVQGQVGIAAQNFLVNGGFESGATDWTTAATDGGKSIVNGSGSAQSGAWFFEAYSFGNSSAVDATLAQTVQTVAGASYALTFFAYTQSLTPGADLVVTWNGVVVDTITQSQLANHAYDQFTVNVTGTGQDALQFAINDPNNNPATYDSWSIDTVSLTPAQHYESTSGSIAFTDADATDTHTVAVTHTGNNYIGQLEAVVNDATHQVNWTFFASDSDLAAMTSAEESQTYTLTLNDGHGGTTTDTVTITLDRPVDSIPVITSPATGSVTQDASHGVVNLIQDSVFDQPNIFNPTLSPYWIAVGGGHLGGSGPEVDGAVNAYSFNPQSTLSQTIHTDVGQIYTIDYWFQGYGQPFTVSENGVQLSSITAITQGWTEESVSFTATSASTTITFGSPASTNGATLSDIQVKTGAHHIVAGTEMTSGTFTFTDADHQDTHTATLAGLPSFVWSGGGLNSGQISSLTAASSIGFAVTDSTGTGSGSVAWNYQISDSALGFLQSGQTLTETYTVNVTDSQGQSAPETVTITVHGDAAPVNSVPGAQTVANTSSLIFNAAHSDAITVSDADNVYVTETLTVSQGTLTLSGTTGLAFTAGDGSGDTTMTFSGTQADINAALSGMTYNAGTGTFADTLSIVSDDGTHSTTSSVGITVTSPVSSLAGASLDLLTASDSGTSHTDNITNVTTPVITVNGLNGTTMVAGDTIEIIDTTNSNAVVGTYVVKTSDLNAGGWKSGALNITLSSTLADGNHTLAAVLVDTSHNVGASSQTLTVVEDTTAPTVTFTGDTLHGSSPDSFTGAVKDNTTGNITIQLFNTSQVAVSGASTSVAVTGGASSGTSWSISASTSFSSSQTVYVQATDAAGNQTVLTSHRLTPAGASGAAMNLALPDFSDHSGLIAATITGLAAGWALSEGVHNADGSWSVLTSDIGSLTVTSPDGYVGALVANVNESWTNADGTHGTAVVADNIEAYAHGSPIFAWSGDDTLTASIGNDTLVFANKIGTDVVHNFDTMHDKIDLVGFNGFASFADVQAHLGHDASGNAVITLADGETITLNGVDAASLNAGDFEFDTTPVTYNTGDMVISDGALLPLSGIVDNSGTIHVSSAGTETDLEIVQHGVSLEGGGSLILSDSSENVIFGSDQSVTLTNVDNTISGAGHLGDGQMTLVNDGTIIADGVNALDIDTGSNAVINTGTLEATGAGGLEVHSDLANSGLLWANGGNLTLDGNVSGSGSALVSGNATLEVVGAFGQQVAFDDTASGTLKIDNAIDFSGMLSGFGNHDSIDLSNILASTASISYTANNSNSGGILTVTDGSNTANLSLTGQYASADFHIAADQTNHVLVQLEQHAHQLTAAA